MGFLKEGIWHGGDQDQIGAQGWEPRREQFNSFVRAQPRAGSRDLPAEAGRYHLIVCPGCPLSHRTAIVHRLKGLGGVVSLASVRPVMGANGREFGTPDAVAEDPVTGARFLHELYRDSDPGYSGRDSTPVLWDRKTRRIVSNTYRDILLMLNREFDLFTGSRVDVQPADRKPAIDDQLAWLGTCLTGLVYRCGFTRSQEEYTRFAVLLGESIRKLALRVRGRPYLVGESLTEADLALFACLVRHDAIYLPLFHCTSERIEDHPSLTRYIERIMAMDGLRETFDLKQTMTHYFGSHIHLNPTRIVPVPPKLSWWRA